MAVVKRSMELERYSDGKYLTLEKYAEKFYIYDECPHVARIGNRITRKSARIMRGYLENHLFGDPIAKMAMVDITNRDIVNFRMRLSKKILNEKAKSSMKREAQTLSPATINKVMSGVKVIFNEALLNRDIPYNPCAGVVRLKPDKNPRGVFTADELNTLFEAKNWNNAEARTCFILAAITGMRCGEVLAFPWECLVDNTLHVIHAWKDTNESGEPKWEKPRTIEISALTKDFLNRYKKYRKKTRPGNLLFCDENAKESDRRGETWWSKNFRAALKKAKLPLLGADGFKRTPHSLRHSLNTILLNAGCNPLLVREYLGWSESGESLTSVQRGYTHFAVMDVKGLLDIIDDLLGDLIREEKTGIVYNVIEFSKEKIG